MYTYRTADRILTNNVIINEYFNDSILIVKHGRFDLSMKFGFDNFNEFELRRDSFIIRNGNYLKVLNGVTYTVLSLEMFNTHRKSYDLNSIPSENWLNKITYVPKEKKQINDTMYFVY